MLLTKEHTVQTVDFVSDCNLDGWVGYLLPGERKEEVRRFHHLYRQHSTSRPPESSDSLIPKTIHQIWLGSSLPPKFQRQTQMWKDHHPSWEYRLWTDDDLAEVDPEIRRLIDSCDCMAQKTDIMRVEILNRVGGLYVDVDYDCYKPCDDLLSSADFVVHCARYPRSTCSFQMRFYPPYTHAIRSSVLFRDTRRCRITWARWVLSCMTPGLSENPRDFRSGVKSTE